MRGRYIDQTWRADPTVVAPTRYRRACVGELQDRWRERLRQHANATAGFVRPVAATATGTVMTGILRRLTQSARNRVWEAEGLLDLIVGLEAGAACTVTRTG